HTRFSRDWSSDVCSSDLNLVTAQNGYFDDNMHMALMRFGHDPSPNSSGTTIPGDTSGIVDGQSLDVHWYDPNNGPDYPYYECNRSEEHRVGKEWSSQETT